ncbi:hypothetical protein HK096_011655, partial [Nowakowskiella sp. JEL0078]
MGSSNVIRIWFLAFLALSNAQTVPPYTSQSVLASYGDVITMIGGIEFSNNLQTSNITNAVWQFDLITAKWKQILPNGNKLVPYGMKKGAEIDGKLYLTGKNSDEAYPLAFVVADLRTPGTVSWTTNTFTGLSDLTNFAVAGVTGGLFILGGRRNGSIVDTPVCVVASFEQKSQQNCAQLPYGYNNMGAASNIGLNWAVTFGGFGNTSFSSSLFYRRLSVQYTLDWATYSSTIISPREAPCIVPFGDGFVVYGGEYATNVVSTYNY